MTTTPRTHNPLRSLLHASVHASALLIGALAALGAGCGTTSAGADGAMGVNQAASRDAGSAPDMVYVPHPLWLGLPASASAVSAKYLKANDWVYGLDNQVGQALTLKNMVPGSKVGIIRSAGCCVPGWVKPPPPAAIDAVLYDYQPNQDGQCVTNSCSNVGTTCTGTGGGLPQSCQNEPSYKCTLAQHQVDFKLVDDAASTANKEMWAMPTYNSRVASAGCPAKGMPLDIDWGLLTDRAEAFVFNLEDVQTDANVAVAGAQKALDSIRKSSATTPVWARIGVTYKLLCGKELACVAAPMGCDPEAEALKLSALIPQLGALRSAHGGQLDGVLIYTDCHELSTAVDKLLASVQR